MKVRYAALALALAVALCWVAPAMAGVTGTAGGNKTDITNKHTAIDNVSTRTIYHDRNADTTVVGNGTRHENMGYGVWSDTNVFHRTTNVSGDLSNPSVQSAISSMRSSLSSALHNEPGRTSGAVSISEGSSTHYTYGDKTFNRNEDTYTHTTATQNLTISDDTIMIGDLDNFANAEVAQGDVTRVTDITDHYDRVIVYDQDRDTHITYTINGTRVVSPIVLDLDGDGKIEASNGEYLPHLNSFTDNNAVLFDFYGNNFPMLTEWVGKNDGLLCRPDANGKVNGTNLFGSTTGYKNGYEHMASLDADHNGALEGAELNGLMVWRDLNHNGVADKGELTSVQDMNITSISVNHENLKSTFVMNGKTQTSVDWWPSIKELRKVDVAQH